MAKGYLAMVLHAHLPFVRHPEYSYFLEEDWLYEAITETYVPLIEVYDGLIADGIDFRITMTITPPLASMLADPFLQQRYVHHLDELIELAGKEVERTRFEGHFNYLARYYLDLFRRTRHVFVDKYHGDQFSRYLVARHEGPDPRFNKDTAHKLVEEANLFIDAAHKAHAKVQASQNVLAAQLV